MYIVFSVHDVPQTDIQQHAFHELSGYPKDPALNKQFTFLDYCMEEDALTVMEKWKVLMAGESTTFEMRWENNTPTGQWVQAACTPIFDDAGNTVSISGCTTDISEQKRAQDDALRRAEALEQVRISQARLLQFTDNAFIGIVILESHGQPLYVNRSRFSITDQPESLASEVDIMSVCYPDDHLKVKRRQEEAINQEKKNCGISGLTEEEMDLRRRLLPRPGMGIHDVLA